MTKPDHNLRAQIATAVRQAVRELRHQDAESRLFGFALCTDDDVRTLYHVACTPEWVREKEPEYDDIGFIYVEWTLSASDKPFDAINDQLQMLADEPCKSEAAWGAARDGRFEQMVLALKDCRDEGLFDSETLLCVGSTDPSDHLEALDMRAVDLLNTSAIADKFAKALGYEKYRRKA